MLRPVPSIVATASLHCGPASAGTLLARAALPIRKCLGKHAQLAPWRRRSERLIGLCNDVALLAKELAKEYDPSTVAWPTL